MEPTKILDKKAPPKRGFLLYQITWSIATQSMIGADESDV